MMCPAKRLAFAMALDNLQPAASFHFQKVTNGSALHFSRCVRHLRVAQAINCTTIMEICFHSTAGKQGA
jgi:hypothetical protein